MSRESHLHVGLLALALAAFLALVGIPLGVSSPSNVSNVVLSPTFWPYVVAGLIGVSGLGLVLTASRVEGVASDPRPPGGRARLGAMAVLMVAYVALLPVLGMVWASVLAFAALAFLVRTRHPAWALLTAVVAPLVLYAFFAHVAGVAVPQGELVRLP